MVLAGAALAQDKPEEKKTDTRARVELTAAEAGALGGFVTDKVEPNRGAEELESSISGKLVEIQKARSASTEKKEEPAKGKGKTKKKGKKAGKKPSSSAPDTIKSGLTDADRQALGRLVGAEIDADHKGPAFVDAIKEELGRLRAERVKASSTADSTPKKKEKSGI